MSEEINSPMPDLDDLPAGGSLKDRLRAKRAEIREDDHLTLTVPGYDGDLAVRYRAIENLDKFAEEIRKKKGRAATAAIADLLVECCDSIMVREGEELEDLSDDSGEPVRFDAGLSDFLGLGTDAARDTVIETFSPGGTRPLAPQQHANSLIAWMQGRDADIDRDLLGE